MQQIHKFSFLRLAVLIAVAILSILHVRAGGIKLNKTSATINIGEALELTATLDGISGTLTFVRSEYTSVDMSQINDYSRRIVGKAAGSCTITAKCVADDGQTYRATCDVTVRSGSLTAPSRRSIRVGETASVTISGTNLGSYSSVTASSSKSAVSVSTSGKTVYITGKEFTTGLGFDKGDAVITVNFQSLSTSFNVYVFPPDVSVSQSTATLRIGETIKLSASVNNPSVNSITWSSSDSSVATVSSSGLVTAKGVGTAKIQAYSGGGSSSCIVTVIQPSISLNTTSATLYLGTTGNTRQLTATTTPSGSSVTWTSSDSNIATVSTSGLVTAKGIGTATITATANGVSTRCTVTVSNPTISVSPTAPTLMIGETKQLTATTGPSGSTVTWKTSNSNIATVSSSGLVTAKAAGTTTITATANGVSSTSTVTVSKPTISLSPAEVTLYVGQTQTIKPTAGNVAAGTSLAYSWSSDDLAVAFVDSDGVVEATGVGMATITARSNGAYADCVVTVYKPTISLSPMSLTLNVGETQQLTATTEPSGSTVTWTTSDPNVAIVSTSGLLTAISSGTATITASANGVSATVTLTVVKPEVSVAKSAVTFTTGTSTLLDVNLIYLPEDAAVTWKSSDESVVTVAPIDAAYAAYYGAPGVTSDRRAFAQITAIGPGSATITAECDGESADIHVAVIDQSDVFNLTSVNPDDPATGTIKLDVGNEMDARKLMNVKWSSSAPNVADVNDNGMVKGVSEGNALITASIGNLSSSFLAVVTDSGIMTEIRGIEALDGDLNSGDGEIELYDINGLKVNASKVQPGIYIMRRGTSSLKVLIK